MAASKGQPLHRSIGGVTLISTTVSESLPLRAQRRALPPHLQWHWRRMSLLAGILGAGVVTAKLAIAKEADARDFERCQTHKLDEAPR